MERSDDRRDTIQSGDRVTIFLKGKKHTVTIVDSRLSLGSFSIPGSGVIGHPFGSLTIAGVEMVIIPTSTRDHMETMRRGPQVILPDDASSILLHSSITPGATVLEAGSGSGGLTLALASAVGGFGKIVSIDLKSANSEMANKNIRKAGLAKRVVFSVGNVKDPEHVAASMIRAEVEEFDAIVLDMPDPWEAMDSVHRFLKIGGTLVGYLPTMNQVETFRSHLEDWEGGEPRFIDVYSQESLVREIAVRKGAVRPEYSMLGHTAYLTFARKFK